MTKLTYDEYYLKQMHFIHNYIENNFSSDNEHVKRIEALKPKQEIHFLDDFLAIQDNKELETTRIGYWPQSTPVQTKKLTLLAPAQADQRHLSLSKGFLR
ncbi:MAG: hypothetical protein H0U73_05800 [Tatlockia sp.]|nr:hypothetical protein [Tatlockia sp.]